MSKADTLGPAPAFSAVRSARRDAVRKIGGEDTAADVTELPVTVISDNPDNPRNHLRNLDETTESVREVGIILPIVVATADAYLRDRPDRAGDLDDGAHYVVIDGHRRLEASRRVGLATIPVRVDNARVATDETLLEAAFVANYHRDDMTDLEEAYALQALVDHYGSQTKASKRLGIPQGTISTKLSLLKLTPELQKDLVTGDRKVEHVRNLGKLTPEEQLAKADERATAAQDRAARAKTATEPSDGITAPAAHELSRRDNSAGPEAYTAVYTPPLTSSASGEAVLDQEFATGKQDPPTEGSQRTTPPAPESLLPEARTARSASPPADGVAPGKPLPYDDGMFVGQHLIRKMPTAELLRARRVINEYVAENGLEDTVSSTA